MQAVQRLKIERIPLNHLLDGLTVFPLISSWVVVLAMWGDLPDRIPTHFNLAGEPDGWGPAGILFLLPALGLLLCVGLFILVRYPHTFNYPVNITDENAPRQYRLATQLLHWTNCSIQWLFLAIVWMTVQLARGGSVPFLPWLLPILLIVIFTTILIYSRAVNRT